MPLDPTRKQSAASARNAEVARAARRAKSAERRAASEAELALAYGAVEAEITGAVEAILANKPSLAARRAAVGLLELGRVGATSPHFDPARSRSVAGALRQTKALLDNLLGPRVR